MSELLRMEHISKRFGSFYANKDISLAVNRGEVLTLLGENGAGKSTLMNILIGLYQPTEGKIFLEGKEVRIESPSQAVKLGIGMVHQHFMLVEAMTVFENIILGDKHAKGLFIDRAARRREIEELSAKLEREGRKPYIIYNGASSARGALGYVEAAAELLEQISSDSSFSSIQNICVPGGNGGLAAGFIYGTALLGNPFHVELISVEHEREPLRAIISGFLKDLEALCGVPMPCTLEETATLHEQYRFGGWGVIDPAVEEFNLEFARTEGIFVEKVYTGKALYGVCDLAKHGYFPQGACFLHSGGIGALFSQYHTSGGAL